MQEFVKYQGTLTEAARSKVRNYANLEAVQSAIRSGELQDGDLFTTVCSVGAICDDIAHEVYYIKRLIPAIASPENQLVTQCQLDAVTGGALTGITVEGTAVPVTNNVAEITGLVSCSDYAARTNYIESCALDAKTMALQAVTDLSTAQSDILDLTTCTQSLNNNKADCSCTNSLNTRVDNLESCAGLACTGTLVASDIANKADCSCTNSLNTRVGTLEGCAGLACTGTLTAANFTLSGTTLTITI